MRYGVVLQPEEDCDVYCTPTKKIESEIEVVEPGLLYNVNKDAKQILPYKHLIQMTVETTPCSCSL